MHSILLFLNYREKLRKETRDLASDVLEKLVNIHSPSRYVVGVTWSGVGVRWSGLGVAWSGGGMEWSGGGVEWSGVEVEWTGGEVEWTGGEVEWIGGEVKWTGGEVEWIAAGCSVHVDCVCSLLYVHVYVRMLCVHLQLCYQSLLSSW